MSLLSNKNKFKEDLKKAFEEAAKVGEEKPSIDVLAAALHEAIYDFIISAEVKTTVTGTGTGITASSVPLSVSALNANGKGKLH